MAAIRLPHKVNGKNELAGDTDLTSNTYRLATKPPLLSVIFKLLTITLCALLTLAIGYSLGQLIANCGP